MMFSNKYIFRQVIPWWVRKIPWRRKWQPIPVLLPRTSDGWRSLVGYSSWGLEELDTTERLHFTTLGRAMAAHSSILAWEIPWTEEPGRLQSMGLKRVGQDLGTKPLPPP